MKGGTSRRFSVSGVCCATEESVLRKSLDRAIGSDAYEFNLMTSELKVKPDVPQEKVLRATRDAGFESRSRADIFEDESFVQRHREGIIAAFAALLAAAGILGTELSFDTAVSRILLLVSIGIGGWQVFRRAIGAIRMRTLDMNVLMSLAATGALVIDRWSEAAAVMVLFSFSLMLESYTNRRTRRAIQSLLALAPEQACREKNATETIVDAREVQPGDIVVIRPGERIPVDGEVVQGASTVNQSILTGESIPDEKTPGSLVYAGSLNELGILRVRTTKRFQDTSLAHIIDSIESAHHSRAPVQNFVDRFAAVYTPSVLGLGFLVAVVPPLFFGQQIIEWTYRALVLLVIACPCALVISTPVTLVSALTNAARRGILIKGGKYIEMLSRTRAIAFDKTGTLTLGRPTVTDVLPLGSMTEKSLVRLAAALEHNSEHHFASAIVSAAGAREIEYADLPVEGFQSIPGRGIRARVDGVQYAVGSHELCHESGACTPALEKSIARLSEEGKTPLVVSTDLEALGIIAVRDTARHTAKETLRQLRRGGIEHIEMLSGDTTDTALRTADELGIGNTMAQLMPSDKVARIRRLKERYGTVAMVGDGINDSPAFVSSSVGIAMGVAGSDTALQTADVVLMSDNIATLPHLFGLSARAIAIVKQNIALAIGLKFMFLLLSVFGYSTLWMAVLADDGAAILVILNGLRLLRFGNGDA